MEAYVRFAHSGVGCFSGSWKTPHACSANKSQKGAEGPLELVVVSHHRGVET